MQDQSAVVDKSLKPIREPQGPVIPDVVCPRCGEKAPPTKVEDHGTYMVYKRRCPTKHATLDGIEACGQIANIGTHEEFMKLQPASIGFTQEQFQQLMAAILQNTAAKVVPALQGTNA